MHWEAVEENSLWEGQVATERVLRGKLEVKRALVTREVAEVVVVSLEREKTAEVTICGRIVVYLFFECSNVPT